MKPDAINSLESNVTILHPNYMLVKEKILGHIFMGRNGYVLFVVGPSRVGKTRLCSHIISDLKKRISDNEIQGYSKPIFITATANPSKTSLWISIYRMLLEKMGDDSYNEKMPHELNVERRKSALKVRGRRHISLDDMKKLLIARVNHYKPLCIFIDEISWVAISGGPISQLLSATFLHEMASILNTKIVLFGTCGATDLLNLNEQLSLRTERVFFDRYRNNKKDIDVFMKTAKEILDACGIKYDRAIMDDKKTLYECSLGCIGEFSAWVQKSISSMMLDNADFLTMKHMLAGVAEYDRLYTAEKKIREFESYCKYAGQLFSLEKFGGESVLQADHKESNSKKIKSKPGKRHPVNDRTGDLFSMLP